MANPYYISYVFGESQSVGYLLGGADRALLTLQFQVEDDGTDVAYLGSAKNLRIRNYGEVSLEYNFDDLFLVPAEYYFEVYDPDGELTDLLFDGSNAAAVNKGFFVKLELKYKNAANYVVEFSGYAVPEAIDFDRVTRVFSFSAIPRTNLINQAYFYPKNYIKSDLPSNPLSLTYQTVGSARKWDWIYLKDLIKKIFELVNPSITTSFYNNLLFYGNTSPEYPAPSYEDKTLTFDDLILDHNYIGAIFNSSELTSVVESAGDLLRDLAFSFGCLAGVLNQDKAFFKQVYYFDPSDVQTISTILADGFRRKFKFGKVDFVDINSSYYVQDLNQLNRYVLQSWKPNGFAPLLYPPVYGHNGLEKTISIVADFNNWLIGSGYISHLKAVAPSSKYYSIYGAMDPNVEFLGTFSQGAPLDANNKPFLSLAHFIANYQYTLRGSLYKAQIYEFPLNGRNYDFIKGFSYDGGNYTIIKMVKNIEEGTTNVEAIKVGEITGNSDEADNGGEEITDPISFSVVENVGGEAAFSYVDIETPKAIASMAAGEILEELVVLIEVAFNSGNITNFQIYDGSGTLFSMANDIIGDFTETGKFVKSIYKKYAAADTLYLSIEGTSDSVGQGSIIIKKLKAA